MRFQPIYDIAELCSRKNINNVVLCPGSRCAPLTLAFTRHPNIETKTFSDERSAGFIALGIAQQTNLPSVLVCTSGTAAYNFSPAVAEAFFSETPLIIFTADRPTEWIAQHDGQTIYQSEIFGRHVKRSFQLPQTYDHADDQWAVNRMINEAINLSLQEPRGPVHVNAPFREPLYPAKDTNTTYSEDVRVMDTLHTEFHLTSQQAEKIKQDWTKYKRILIVAGQHHDDQLIPYLESIHREQNIPVVTDILSNIHTIDGVVSHSDLFLGQANEAVRKSLHPDLLITFGKSLISKNLKIFLRHCNPVEHWHVQPHGIPADTFKNITSIFNCSPGSFFSFLSNLKREQSFENQKQDNFCKVWDIEERRTLRTLQDYVSQLDLNELQLVNEIIQCLPSDSNLHLANSMSVRYANFIGLNYKHKGVKVYANRGTSGIDGCTSTTVGHALASDKINFLVTGDLAFFYDRNAFWHNYSLPNLRVIVLNNHGGSIFNMIDGPASLPEASEYFITKQKLNAKKLCEEFDFDYILLDHKRKLKNALKDFFDFDGKTKVLELESDTQLNKSVFENLKTLIKKNYES